MSERREPTISTLRAEKDLLDGDPPRARASQARGPAAASQRPAAAKSGLAWFSFILALVALTGLGFTLVEFFKAKQVMDDQSKALSIANERITTLEDRLALSDDESTQSITVIQAKVKENASEIRKLWGVAYDKNRKAIAKLNTDLTTLSKSVTSSDASTKKSIKEISGELTVLSELMNAQQAVIQQVDQTRITVDQKVSQLSENMQTLQARMASIISCALAGSCNMAVSVSSIIRSYGSI